jgi:hypothetical protein
VFLGSRRTCKGGMHAYKHTRNCKGYAKVNLPAGFATSKHVSSVEVTRTSQSQRTEGRKTDTTGPAADTRLQLAAKTACRRSTIA